MTEPSPSPSPEFRHPLAVLIGLGLLAIVFWSAFTFDENKPPAAAGQIAGVTSKPTPGATETRSPVIAPSAAASPVIAPSAAASPVIAPSAAASPVIRPTASPSASPRPSSGRYALLDPCPDRPRCWLYTVRSGDNLYSIGRYFGVPLKTVKRLNPWTQKQGIHAGQQLVLPPPTR